MPNTYLTTLNTDHKLKVEVVLLLFLFPFCAISPRAGSSAFLLYRAVDQVYEKFSFITLYLHYIYKLNLFYFSTCLIYNFTS